jgi:hypothetical protein
LLVTYYARVSSRWIARDKAYARRVSTSKFKGLQQAYAS